MWFITWPPSLRLDAHLSPPFYYGIVKIYHSLLVFVKMVRGALSLVLFYNKSVIFTIVKIIHFLPR